VPTFREVFGRYLTQYAIPERRPRTVKGVEDMFRRDELPAWADRPIDGVESRDIVELVAA
jgi:hypothetical protein